MDRIHTPLVYLIAFSSGFVIMSFELLGGRLLNPWFGSSIYVWGSVISVFMIALALGYLLGGKLSLYSPSLRKLGVFLILGCIFIAPQSYLAEAVMSWVFERVLDPRGGSLLAAMTLFVPATIVLGAISPYSVRLLVNSTRQSGNVAGKLYFVSTIGSALGTIGTSFYFVLWFSHSSIIVALSLALVGLGAIAMVSSKW